LGDQISVISSVKQKKGATPSVDLLTEQSKFASNGWHADITFEPVPSDYAILKIHTLPPFGGDTASLFPTKPSSLIEVKQQEADLDFVVMGIRV
jgi:alpha-ketoglutarate-dependent taurine dioxygenase